MTPRFLPIDGVVRTDILADGIRSRQLPWHHPETLTGMSLLTLVAKSARSEQVSVFPEHHHALSPTRDAGLAPLSPYLLQLDLYITMVATGVGQAEALTCLLIALGLNDEVVLDKGHEFKFLAAFSDLGVSPYSTFPRLDIDTHLRSRGIWDAADCGWFGDYCKWHTGPFATDDGHCLGRNLLIAIDLDLNLVVARRERAVAVWQRNCL